MRRLREVYGFVDRPVDVTEALLPGAGDDALAQVLADPEIDLVDITAPNALHHEIALAAIAAGKPADLASLDRAALLTAECDMPDEVRAKLHKAIGQAHQAFSGIGGDGTLDKNAAQNALAHFKRALELHDRVGVKKEIERLERALKPAAET